jgi:uncharacterized YccA/Bax inhibitor family protein
MATALLRTSNPALRDDVFRSASRDVYNTGAMTIEGTAIKSLLLVGILTLTAAFSWSQTHGAEGFALTPQAAVLLFGGAIGGFILALVTTFVPRFSPVTAPLYAACEGLFLGALSGFYEAVYHGIIFQAVGLTIGTLALLLGVYATGLVRVTQGFRAGVIAATGAVCLVYLVSMVMRMFGVNVPLIYESGIFGIGFSMVVVVIAALNLVLDFDLISTQAAHGAPKYMEWYGGFALLVTLVWLYLEVLRLLSKLRSRD